MLAVERNNFEKLFSDVKNIPGTSDDMECDIAGQLFPIGVLELSAGLTHNDAKMLFPEIF